MPSSARRGRASAPTSRSASRCSTSRSRCRRSRSSSRGSGRASSASPAARRRRRRRRPPPPPATSSRTAATRRASPTAAAAPRASPSPLPDADDGAGEPAAMQLHTDGTTTLAVAAGAVVLALCLGVVAWRRGVCAMWIEASLRPPTTRWCRPLRTARAGHGGAQRRGGGRRRARLGNWRHPRSQGRMGHPRGATHPVGGRVPQRVPCQL